MSMGAEGNDGNGNDLRPRLIVGIGASAGGLEACKRFLAAMPAESGMAFVIVMHLDPSRASHIAEILKTATAMEVVQISGEQAIEPDHVYVIAPDSSLAIRGGVLNPNKLNDEHGRRKPIDAFFSSLADDQKERAVAIVLSGAGNNGSAGVQDVKAAGGLCIAQDPETAQYDSMPRSTIGTGVADHILPPEQMPRVLLAYAEHSYVVGAARGEAQGEQPEAFGAILDLLGNKHRIDFRVYKKGTLSRRTERRMGLTQISEWQAYFEYLQQQPEEVNALYCDLLIGVTHFFRDREVWEHIGSHVTQRVFGERAGEAPLRTWVPGCATGEEPYSLAILLLEQLARVEHASKLQIYATDVNADAVAFARRGLYPSTIATDVSPERLRRFFTRQGEHFQVNGPVRDSVTFAVHNLLTDPPFSKLDVVTCRNVLIYLEPHAQDRILELFHFALRPGGLLVLGSSETIGRQTDLFETLSKKHRIFQSSAVTRANRYHVPEWFTERAPVLPALPAVPQKGPKVARLVEQLVLSRYTSACVAINQSFEILCFFGPTHDYLMQPTGEVRWDLLSWVRTGLYPRLRSALRSAVEHKERVTITDMRVERDGATHRVECTIEPVNSVPGAEGLFLVAFRDVPEIPSAGAAAVAAEPGDPLVLQLEGELKDARQELQSTVEQLESTNEEYRASHEELLSLNEELQSSNEELETSKEELQSLNEEMVTINRQLEEKNGELRAANADLTNLFASTEIPTIFLDREFRVRRFTPAATDVMRLVPSDVGRSIEHIKERCHDERLLDDVAKVLEKLSPVTAEVPTDDGRWYLRRALPYRTEDDRIDGVCIIFNEITAQKNAAAEIDDARVYAEAIVATVRTPLLVLDDELRVVSANKCFYDTFQVSSAETLNRKIYDLGNRQWDVPRLRDLLEKVLPEAREIQDYDIEHEFEHIGRRIVRLNAQLMVRPGRPSFILLAEEDITHRTRAQESARQRADELAEEHRRKDEFLAMLGHELRNPLSALAHGLELLGKVRDDRVRSEELRGMMARQAKRIGTLLDQLLDIARVISGKVELSKVRVDLKDVVRAAVETVRPFMETQKHQLTISLPSERSVFVIGDPVRLTQVLENLLTNAFKYTDEGGQIRVRVDSDKDKARITVRDTGIGIAAEFLPHVFEAFTQAPRTLERAKGGLGLGLPLVQRLVEAHGGRVDVSSLGLGQGSEFIVTLPRLLERPSKQRLADEAVPSEPGKIGLWRILVVDDEKDTAGSLADLLGKDGHQTLAVYDGPAALAAVRTFDPDVVLLDLGLPGMDGYEVARRVREEQDDKKILLIAVTGYQNDAARLKRAGFDQHLLKPPDMGTLFSLLADWDREGEPVST